MQLMGENIVTLEEFSNDGIVIPSVIEFIDVTLKYPLDTKPATPPIITEDWSTNNTYYSPNDILPLPKQKFWIHIEK